MFDMPFEAPPREDMFAKLDGALGDWIGANVAACTGFEVMGYWDNGLRHISARRKLATPGDCAGLSLRTLASDDHQRVFRKLGFDPKVIDVKDLGAAVASGEVDAQENPLTNIYNFGLHAAQPEITLTGHLQGVAPVWFHRDTVARWPEDLRHAVQAALQEAGIAQRSFALADDLACADALRTAGAHLHALTESEAMAFRDAVADQNARTRARVAPGALQLFEQPQEMTA